MFNRHIINFKSKIQFLAIITVARFSNNQFQSQFNIKFGEEGEGGVNK